MPYIQKEELQTAIDMVNDVTGTHRVSRCVERNVLQRMGIPVQIFHSTPRKYIAIDKLSSLRVQEIMNLLNFDGSYYSHNQRTTFVSAKRIAKELLNDDIGDYHWRDIKEAQKLLKGK
jgi:hypothetical protein